MEPSINSNPLTSTFRSNNFLVKLIFNDTQLIIDAEDNVSKHFQLIITPEHVQELTSDVFEDLQFLHAGLLEGFECKDPSIKVDISDYGKLTYCEEQERRGLKRVKKFTLILKEEIMDEKNRQERQLELQTKKIAQLEARIAKLEQENNKLKSDSENALIEKIATMENTRIPQIEEMVNKLEEVFGKKIGKIEHETIPQIQQAMEQTLHSVEKIMNLLGMKKPIDQKLPQPKLQPAKNEDIQKNEFFFDTTCAEAGKFSFSNSNKTVIKQSSGSYASCFAKDSLQKQRKTQFSVKADSITSNGYVIIGICPEDLKSSTSVYSNQGVHCYYGGGGGYVYINGQQRSLSNNGLKTGSKITIIVDFSNKTISFEFNGNSIYNSELDSSMISSYDYYPFVELYDPNDKVSFI